MDSVRAHPASSVFVIENADVRTMTGPTCRALAWQDGRILAAGDAKTVMRAAGTRALRWDAQGRTILPGFIDAHQHPALYSLFSGGPRLTAPRVRNIRELTSALREAAASVRPGEWVTATEWNDEVLEERRAPTRDELDDAVPDHPVFALHYTCHRAVANTRALELAGIGRGTPEPVGGLIGRDRRGMPSGLLIERAMTPVEQLARASLVTNDVAGFFARLARHYESLLRFGITRIADALVPPQLAQLYREACARGIVRLPTVLMPATSGGYLEPPWDAVERDPTGTTDGLLSVGPVKLVLDGAPTCAMCLNVGQALAGTLGSIALSVKQRSFDPIRVALSARPELGTRLRTGIRLYPPGEATKLVTRAVGAGFSVAAHATGNDAIDIALAAYGAAGSNLHRAGRPRLEHFLFASRRQVKRAADIGAVIVTQPNFLALPGFDGVPRIPGLATMPLRWLLDAGVTVAASSDYPCASLNPLDGIAAAVHRRTATRVHTPSQCVSIDEALRAYTRDAAKALGCDAECGSLEPGKRADIVVLDGPLRDEPDGLAVHATVLGGAIAYGSLPFSAGP